MPGAIGTRVYIQTPSDASAGGGAVTRTWSTSATTWAQIEEQGGIQYVRGVPSVAVQYRLRLRKPIFTLTGTELVPTTQYRVVTADESTTRTFHVSEVQGFGPRERFYTLLCNKVSS